MKNNISAFPQHVCENCQDPMTGNFVGMTLRDYFAGQALIGLLSNPESMGLSTNISFKAYNLADAMLAEREKGKGR